MKNLIIQIRTIGFSSNEIVNFLETDPQIKDELIVNAVTGQTIKVKTKLSESSLVGKIENRFPEVDVTAGESQHNK